MRQINQEEFIMSNLESVLFATLGMIAVIAIGVVVTAIIEASIKHMKELD